MFQACLLQQLQGGCMHVQGTTLDNTDVGQRQRWQALQYSCLAHAS